MHKNRAANAIRLVEEKEIVLMMVKNSLKQNFVCALIEKDVKTQNLVCFTWEQLKGDTA